MTAITNKMCISPPALYPMNPTAQMMTNITAIA